MCLIDAEQLGQEMGNMENNNNIDSNDNDIEQWSLQVDRTEENLDRETPAVVSSSTQNMLNSFQLESIGEDTVVADRKQSLFNFVPALRSGEWSDIGGRTHMEETHLCIGDLAKKFGYNLLSEEAISFYGISFSRPLLFTTIPIPSQNSEGKIVSVYQEQGLVHQF